MRVIIQHKFNKKIFLSLLFGVVILLVFIYSLKTKTFAPFISENENGQVVISDFSRKTEITATDSSKLADEQYIELIEYGTWDGEVFFDLVWKSTLSVCNITVSYEIKEKLTNWVSSGFNGDKIHYLEYDCSNENSHSNRRRCIISGIPHGQQVALKSVYLKSETRIRITERV